MKNLIKNIYSYKKVLRSIFKTIYFNFHYLPFNQAIKLPIILYKPRFLKLDGTVEILCNNIKFGMIRLGFPTVSIFPNSGIVYENKGGKIIFRGQCSIGNNSAISVGGGCGNIPLLEFGERFSASTSLKLVCYNKIIFFFFLRIGRDCLFMDTDFHKLTNLSGGYTKGFGEIIIGQNTWFGTRCMILKNIRIPDFCTISAGSILNRQIEVSTYSVIGSSANNIVKKTGLYRNIDDDTVVYEDNLEKKIYGEE